MATGHYFVQTKHQAYDVYGDKFKELYERYEKEGRARNKRLKYYGGNLNHKLKQVHLTCCLDAVTKNQIKEFGNNCNSNLCCEILQYSLGRSYCM